MNLIFDMDDTLYDQMEPFGHAYNDVFGAQAQYEVPVERLFVKSRLHSDVVFDQVQNGLMSDDEMHVYRITHAFADFGIAISVEQALAFQERYAFHQQYLEVHPFMKELLDYGQQHGLRMGIITNGPAEHQAAKVKQLGMERWIAPEDIFISGKIGIAKPHTAIFRYVEQQMQIVPADTWYFGDAYANDVVGAKRAGWHCVWINRRQIPLPENAPYVPDANLDKTEHPLDLVRHIIEQGNSSASTT
ncbi:HAD family hydrolase [Paenibacillus campi]|uniref:HAD family hydrolase n=1 Tax=Paenibacillus campi TaxID=3106031 RepID=UPI002AFFB30C|nr:MULTISPECIES: HAD family hydrolase [unclassified Paenibacillus]